MCLDSRHVVPIDAWVFRQPGQASEDFPMHWEELLPGVWRFWNDPVDGIGSHSYLICKPAGNVLFEGAAIYSEAALAKIQALGGVQVVSASHPHSYGALWQIQDHFDAGVALHTADFAWSGAFRVTHPFDTSLELVSGLRLIHTGVHFAGHAVLHDTHRGILFCGDALKFEFNSSDPRVAVSISTHKAFVRGVPLTIKETQHYKEIFSALAFTRTYTPFEQIHNVDSATVKAFLERVEREYPQPEFINVDALATSAPEAGG